MSLFHQQQQGSARGPRPCAAGCSFFGSPATLDMCSVCYKKHCAVANGAGPAANSAAVAPRYAVAPRSAVAAAVTIGSTASSAVVKPAATGGVSFAPTAKDDTASGLAEVAAVPPSSAAKKAQPTRCAACYKKVGLTGFVCRCSKTFCGTHRHAEEHGCSFDFKGAGRDAIARNNPLVKGDKLTGKI